MRQRSESAFEPAFVSSDAMPVPTLNKAHLPDGRVYSVLKRVLRFLLDGIRR